MRLGIVGVGGVAVISIAALLAGFLTARATPLPAPDIGQAGQALLAAARPGPAGGSAWASVIQAPHQQTDRDVGAAGIAYGLLALSDVTRDPVARERYLDAARDAADFLVAVQADTPGRFPDFRDPDETAPMAYTSFDDGAAGIADLLWSMWERTGDERYRSSAVAGMEWLVGRAEGVDGKQCPELCRWAWSDYGTASYRNGIGEGQAGIVYALSVFAERTGDERYARYARGGAAYLESRLDGDGGMPESSEERQRNTGYLSGAAGAAFVFLRMYAATGEQRWLADAEACLAFLDRTATPAGGGVNWPIMVDGAGRETNDHRATGMEEGAAGIGWVSLQAYAVTGEPRHLERALAAGRWLQEVAVQEGGGVAWAEFEGSDVVHTGINSGAAGTGWFLHDLGLATGDATFLDSAQQARAWLAATAVPTPDGLRWHGSREDTTWLLAGEPSWHWGGAGVVGFLARLEGWDVDSPGMQPALIPGQPRRS